MAYKVTVQDTTEGGEKEVYSQVVERIDLPALFQAVNAAQKRSHTRRLTKEVLAGKGYTHSLCGERFITQEEMAAHKCPKRGTFFARADR